MEQAHNTTDRAASADTSAIPIPTLHLLTTDQAAQFLSLKPQYLRQLRARGAKPASAPHIPFVKIGGSVRYRMQDLLAFVESSIRRSAA